LLDRLRSSDSDPALLPDFLDGLLNSNTGFFRHPTAINALTRQVLPQLFSRKSAEIPGTLRIWSAGCATGEEPYSIAMAVSEALLGNGTDSTANGYGTNGSASGKDTSKDKNSASRSGGITMPAPATLSRDWSVHIVGSDLLPSSIQTAERGLYPQSALSGLPPAIIRACFSKIASANAEQKLNGSNGNGSNGSGLPITSRGASPNGSDPTTPAPSHLLVKPRLRSLVTFNTMNLIRPVYIGRFDCIFCMDVLPHLSRAQRIALVERLHLYLEPGGYLFLGQTEKLCAPNLNFRPETYDGYTFHRKPLAASAAYGR
jgi:chemotaxis methyl-accepting protein methylase